MLVTNRDIEYRAAPYGYITTIPKGTSVIPATNLPDTDKYWAEPWQGMSAKAEGWVESYGFMIDSVDVDCQLPAS